MNPDSIIRFVNLSSYGRYPSKDDLQDMMNSTIESMKESSNIIKLISRGILLITM